MRNEDTTRKDVSTEEQVIDEIEEQEKEDNFPSNVRNSMIDEIADKVAKEDGSYEEEEIEKTEETEDTDHDEIEEEEHEDEMITIKVDGEEKQYPKKTVDDHGGVKAFQMELAADLKMKEAAEIRKTYEQKLLEIDSRIPDKKIPPKKTEPNGDVDDDDDLHITDDGKNWDSLTDEEKQKYLDRAHLTQYGNEEDLARTLYEDDKKKGSDKKVSTRQQPSTIDRNLLEQELSLIEIKRRFNAPPEEGGFKDLMDDPDMRDIVIRRIDKAIEDGKDGSAFETYQEIGQQVREKFNLGNPTKEEDEKGGDKKPKISDDIKEKKVVKKKIDNLPSANARMKSATDENETDQSEDEMRKEGINEIRRARGQTLP